ncbi:NAD(P)H-hydrate dehydratase [Ignisphaera sp. 4213-co]|uniref:Bifunctional NAD(P)H-hydrate repair enzyme n=1 Tax=Ignisphaera cupida TaxID=3050454 RepID=A0ABD4Z5R4_9CREN|nr:NAD(P)H-hydrate dehydratase [Ignisphaera sp. 4213-co]MDK6028636.1 NAD(P)H-hydrate dehydratase [Ignisphaera sp. 4213-co]
MTKVNIPLRLKVCSVEEMRRIDEEAFKKFGVSHDLLMENAGTAIFSLIANEIGLFDKRFCVVAGTGNNGGDALVAARRLYAAGCNVEVYIVGDPTKFTELARKNFELVKSMGIPIRFIQSDEDAKNFYDYAKNCDVFIVGIFGIGLKGEVTGFRRSVIEAINKLGKTVISVDMPSGIGGDNGKVYGVAVKSDYTVTFGLPKYGNILYPGYHYCGKLYVSRLSYPPQLLESEDIKVELNYPLPPPERVRWGHKGTFGKFLAVAGARYYYGAPYYVAYSFLKAGGGYSRLAAPKSIVPYIAARNSEIVFIPLEETSEGSIAKSNLDYLLKLVIDLDIDIVAVGPGASLNPETQEFITDFVAVVEKPVIVDGDGITAIARNVDVVKKRRFPTIITPHLGEFSRLINLKPAEILEDPINILRRTCIDLNSYIVLKGAHTLICKPDGYIYINMTGNPGMAKAGMGDVLTGTIAAMYGIGYRDIGDAARMGVLIHGLAGDLAAEELGEDGVTPDDVIEYLPKALKVIRENISYVIEKYMPRII